MVQQRPHNPHHTLSPPVCMPARAVTPPIAVCVDCRYFVNPSRLDFQALMLNSPFGADAMPFRPKEFYGWAVPVVANNTYNFFFNSSFEWTSATFRYSEPSWVTPSEWLMLSTNYSSYRYQVCT
jgi:hypothetical protein